MKGASLMLKFPLSLAVVVGFGLVEGSSRRSPRQWTTRIVRQLSFFVLSMNQYVKRKGRKKWSKKYIKSKVPPKEFFGLNQKAVERRKTNWVRCCCCCCCFAPCFSASFSWARKKSEGALLFSSCLTTVLGLVYNTRRLDSEFDVDVFVATISWTWFHCFLFSTNQTRGIYVRIVPQHPGMVFFFNRPSRVECNNTSQMGYALAGPQRRTRSPRNTEFLMSTSPLKVWMKKNPPFFDPVSATPNFTSLGS